MVKRIRIFATSGILFLMLISLALGQMPNFPVGKLNQIRFADNFAGATPDAKIAACIADLPAAGGTCDARGLQGAQVPAGVVNITANVSLLIGSMTYAGDPGGSNYLFNITGSGASLICSGRNNSILRYTGAGAGGVLKIGFQGSDPPNTVIRGVTIKGCQIEKIAAATSGHLIWARAVVESIFDDIQIANSTPSGVFTAGTGSSAGSDNFKCEQCLFDRFTNIRTELSGRDGLYLTKTPSGSPSTTASNLNVLINNQFESNTRAGLEIDNSEHNVIGPGNAFEDFLSTGQHGILLSGSTEHTLIFGNWFESQVFTSNDIRITGPPVNGDTEIHNNDHIGGPTVDVYLDYAPNVRVYSEHSNNNGTVGFAQVTANTDRAWFAFNIAGSVNIAGCATCYVADSGTLTTIWGTKSGDPDASRLILPNARALQGRNAAGNGFYNLAQLSAGNAVVLGDPTTTLSLSGTSFSTNGTGPTTLGGSLQVTTATVTAATPIVGAGAVGFGTTAGFGNGTPATAMTTTTKGTGSGPATPQTVVNYLKINIAGTDYWIPLVQ